ncbi:MAG: hypothetical protein JOZ08_19665 [Verrucomicrobia bacterium]|nr:hypothetical protein [Verrucomicrobiota bacterium]MBV8277537.1 hypothetical protein [Verrucomicrobiota bacterium]
MKVARYEVPGTLKKKFRPVLSAIARMAAQEGNGMMIGQYALRPWAVNATYHPSGSLRDGSCFGHSPGNKLPGYYHCIPSGQRIGLALIRKIHPRLTP